MALLDYWLPQLTFHVTVDHAKSDFWTWGFSRTQITAGRTWQSRDVHQSRVPAPAGPGAGLPRAVSQPESSLGASPLSTRPQLSTHWVIQHPGPASSYGPKWGSDGSTPATPDTDTPGTKCIGTRTQGLSGPGFLL